jgi:hypothetical protein
LDHSAIQTSMKPHITQELFEFAVSTSTLKEEIAKLHSAAQNGVARGAEDFKAQQALDYVYQLLCDDAPCVWGALCPRCRAILTGLEEPDERL